MKGSVLVANRGEIAVRVMKTARRLGLKTFALATEKERGLPHTLEADVCIWLPEGPLSENYLNIELIINLCKQYEITYLHPGYGFLSENPRFANELEKTKTLLVGPKADVMKLMGDKQASKVEMQKYNFPLIPGYHGDDQEPVLLHKEAEKIGYPVLIKASAGGGGKGMRIVRDSKSFLGELESAKREALNAFGNERVLIEKFIEDPRHIEVQVFGDGKGEAVHLYERECSIQRRYQKIVEETPSPALSEEKRLEICETARLIASRLKYRGAGTVEFIYADSGDFYFLEMNTRLQVEHPITEMLTGEDLVEWQLFVAEHEKLPKKQEGIIPRGHALEVRIYAEDPEQNFLPQIGKILKRGEVSSPGVRLDSGYRDGNEVTIDFDPMLAKLITWGDSRDQSITRMREALKEIPFAGIKNNREFLIKTLSHSSFLSGETYTHFIENHLEELLRKEDEFQDLALHAAIAAVIDEGTMIGSSKQRDKSALNNSWQVLGGFRNI